MKGCSFIQNTSDDHAWCTVHVCREIKCIKAERDRAIKVVEAAREHNSHHDSDPCSVCVALREYDGGGK